MKKLLALLMALAMAFAMVACGSSGGNSTASSGADASSSGSAAASGAASSEASSEAGTADGDLITVGFAQVGHESDWRTASTQSCQDVFTAENGYELVFVDCDQDSAAQLEAVRGFIEQDVDYIIIDPIVSTGWDTVLVSARLLASPSSSSTAPSTTPTTMPLGLAPTSRLRAWPAGEWLNAYAAERGIDISGILVIEGTTGSSAQLGRTEGFQEVADNYGWTILDLSGRRLHRGRWPGSHGVLLPELCWSVQRGSSARTITRPLAL